MNTTIMGLLSPKFKLIKKKKNQREKERGDSVRSLDVVHWCNVNIYTQKRKKSLALYGWRMHPGREIAKCSYEESD